MVGYVAAGHKVIPPNRKNHRNTQTDRDRQKALVTGYRR
jgi:hypothetical protein